MKGTAKETESKFLTEKALKLMRVMAEHGYLTINEIGLIYKHQTHAYRVLKTLKELELIAEFDTGLRPRTAYVLQAKGYRALKDRELLRVERRVGAQDFKPFIFNHRMTCARAGLRLKEQPFVQDFWPESLLWERRRDPKAKVCDGEFLFAPPGYKRARRVGLEVELTLKNADKLRESFRGLADRTDLEQVWWLAGSWTIARALAHWSQRIFREDQPHFFGTVEEFFSGREASFCLHDASGQVYEVGTTACSLPDNPEPEAAAPTPEEVATTPPPPPGKPPPPPPRVEEAPARKSPRRIADETWERLMPEPENVLALALAAAVLLFGVWQTAQFWPGILPAKSRSVKHKR